MACFYGLFDTLKSVGALYMALVEADKQITYRKSLTKWFLMLGSDFCNIRMRKSIYFSCKYTAALPCMYLSGFLTSTCSQARYNHS